MAYCGNCGTENRPGARFCRICGSQMELVESPHEAPDSPVVPVDFGEPLPEPSERIEQSVMPGALSEMGTAAEAAGAETAGTEEPPAAPVDAVLPNQPAAWDSAPAVEDVENSDGQAPETPLLAGAPLSDDEQVLVEAPPPVEEPIPVEAPAPAAEPSSSEAPAPVAEPLPERLPVPLQGPPFQAPPFQAPPLADGTPVAGRYRIHHLAETRPGGERVYEAEDMQACWSCAAEQLQPGLRYCEACGAVLSQWPMVALVESDAAGEPIAENGRQFHVEPLIEPAPAQPPTFIHLAVGQQTHPGMQRLVNEDSLLVFQVTALCESRPAPQVGLFAVADGIGGSDAGEVASRMAVRAMADAFSRLVVQPLLAGEVLLSESLGEHLKEIVRHANRLILDKRKEKGLDMGATLTALLLYGEEGVIANVGDSRTYLFREGKLAQVTADHSVVASLVAGGLIKPEEVYFHEQRNVILRSLGDRSELEVDIFPVQARPGDRFVLCCDGLWEMVRGGMIEDVLLEQPDPQAACNRLVQYANQSGGDDNISVVVVDVHSL